MFRWNQGLVVTIFGAISILAGFDNNDRSQIVAQAPQDGAQYPSNVQQSYYSRPDRNLEPDEFLAKAKQSNSESVLQHYERLIRQNSSLQHESRSRVWPGYPGDHTARRLPDRLVPPAARSTAPAVKRTNPEPVTRPNTIRPNTNFGSPKKTAAHPGFSLSGAPPQAPPSKPIRTGTNDPHPRTHMSHSGNRPRKGPAVSRARHIVAQWSGDSRPPNERQRTNSARFISYHQDIPPEDANQQNSPFAEPPADIVGGSEQGSQQDNPFADPPADVLNEQRLQDPFDKPPTDVDPGNQPPVQQNNQPPVQPQNEPDVDNNPFPGVDPFPNTPNSINPGDELQNANDSPQEPDGPSAESGPAPDRLPNSTQNRLRRGKFPSGPYESFNGYQPKRLLPAPPERYFPEYAQPLPEYSQPYLPPGHDYLETDNQLSQPTLFADDFDQSRLYEGISYDEDTRLASYECDACQTPGNLRMPIWENLRNRISRFTRMGRYDYQTYGQGVVQQQRYPTQRYSEVRPLRRIISACGGCGQCDICLNQNSQLARDAMVANRFDNANREMLNANCCCQPMFYFSVFGGYSQLENTSQLNRTNLSFPVFASNGSVEFNDGFAVGVALGQWQGRNLRSEIEYLFRQNDVSNLWRSGAPLIGIENEVLDGSIASHAGMFNAYWDFNRRLFGFQPYVGAGIGFAFIDLEASVGANGVPVADIGDESSFAYQLIVGGTRRYGPCSEWFIEYRYFNTDSLQISVSEFTGNTDYQSDDIFIGFRRRF